MLVNNETIAKHRLLGMDKSLRKDLSLHIEYQSIFRDYESQDIIEELTPNQIRTAEFGPFYLPHRPVIHPGSISTKIRPVFDT